MAIDTPTAGEHNEQAQSRPTLCNECKKPMDSPVCCAGCGALNPLPPSMFTYFELFGIEPSYNLDLVNLRRIYMTLTRSIHPDIAGQSSSKVRRQSLDLSSGLNRAYDTLRDPVARAEYLLTLAGGPSAGDDKSVAPELLGEVMMIREEIEEAFEANDKEATHALNERITARQQTAIQAVAMICRDDDLNEPGVQKQLRQQINEVKYWKNLTRQLPVGTAE